MSSGRLGITERGLQVSGPFSVAIVGECKAKVPLVTCISLNLHLVPLSSSKILVMPMAGSEHISGRQWWA